MDFQGTPRDPWTGEPTARPAWVIPVAIVIVGLGVATAALIATSAGGGKTKTVIVESVAPPSPQPATAAQPALRPEASEHRGGAGPLGPGAASSFGALAGTIPAQIGLAVAPFGGGEPEEFGELREGHAWSTIKVPILVTLMRERGPEGLGSEEAEWARAALTASDNEAAAELFGALESAHGGLEGASLAVGETLAAGGDTSTTVATAPPPPGAVSTYGQTEWSLGGAAQFSRALGEGCLLDSAGTSYVEGLMEEVIPEQRWGLGEASFPTEWSVAIKGGWGPEGSSAGPYLVRQSGILGDGDSGFGVAMIAIDESGSYEAGAADLTQIAEWLAGRIGDRGGSASAAACN